MGIVPRMLTLAQDLPAPVNLALSLHAPTQELRQSIVPVARAYPLPALMGALEHYQQQRWGLHPQTVCSDGVPSVCPQACRDQLALIWPSTASLPGAQL